MSERKKIAAIVTTYRPHSHGDVIITKFLKGFPSDQGVLEPRVEVASMYVDQFPKNDLSRRFAAEHNVPIYDSIPEALCLGGKELAVDGVLLIGEHGEYAWNEKEQHLYPRKFFLTAITAVATGTTRALRTGYVDPETELPKFIDDLKAAGFDIVMAEIVMAKVEKQYSEWKATQEE